MKKIGLVFLLMNMFLLAGCGRVPKIGICLRNTDAGVTIQMMNRLEKALKEQNCRVTLWNAVNDQSRQNGQVRTLLDSGCDLLVIEPVMTAEAEEIVIMAQQEDIPVIFLNYAPEKEVLERWERVCYIGSDLSTPGAVLQELLRSLPCSDPQYLIMSGPKDHIDANAWTEVCRKAEQGNCMGVEYGDWSAQSGKRIAGRYLARQADRVDVLICMGDDMALGAINAVKDAQQVPGEEVYLLGVGGQRQALLQVAEGNMYGMVCPDISALTRSVSDAVQCYLTGQTPQKWTSIAFIPVTKANVEEYLK